MVDIHVFLYLHCIYNLTLINLGGEGLYKVTVFITNLLMVIV